MNIRSQNQKLVALSMNEKFIEKIDAALPCMGYSDRSSFIRDAIIEKLHTGGVRVSPALGLAPSRIGKGGRSRKPKPNDPVTGAVLPV